jgi:hypothetical protein
MTRSATLGRRKHEPKRALSLFQVQPVGRVFEHLLVRPDRLAEVFELAQGDEAQSLKGHAVELEILDVPVDRVFVVLLQSAFGDPLLEVFRGPCVDVVPAVVRGVALAS